MPGLQTYNRAFKLPVESGLLRIVLCQVIPGKEAEVCRTLGSEPRSTCLVSFSEYDLVGLIPCTLDTAKSDYLEPFASFLREYEEVICFCWEGSLEALGALSKTKPAKAVSFLKLNEAVTRCFGVEAEIAFCRWLDKESRSGSWTAQAIPFGTLGWAEVALVWAASDFNEIINHMLYLRQLCVEDLTRSLKHGKLPQVLAKEPIFVFSHSLPCTIVDPDLANPYQSRHIEKIAEPVCARVMVMCSSGVDAHVVWAIQEQFGDQYVVDIDYGRYDMAIESATGKMSVTALARLLEFVRGLGPEYIHSTAVRMSGQADDVLTGKMVASSTKSCDSRDSLEEEGIWRLRSNLLEELAQFEMRLDNPLLRFHPLLLQMLARYRAVRTVRGLEGLLDDMEGFLNGILNDVDVILFERTQLAIPTTVNQELRAIYDAFEVAHRLFHLAFDQRIGGAQIGMANAARAFTSIRSAGVQRITTAANVIPRKLLGELAFEAERPLPWKGFIVFGYDSDTLRLQYGAMNIPAANLLDLAEWWMLVHEAGHEFVQITKLLNRMELKALIDKACAASGSAPPLRGVNARFTRKEIENLVEELVAEVFDFQFGFGRDWWSYVSISWDFLQNHLQGRPTLDQVVQYLIRYTFVYFYHLEVEGALDKNEKVDAAITRGRSLGGQIYSYEDEEACYAEGENILDRNIRHRAFARYGSVAALIQEHLVPLFEKSAPKVAPQFGQVDAKVIAYWYTVLEPLRSLMVDVFSKANVNVAQYTTREGQKRARRAIVRSLLCPGGDIRPVEMILALKREKINRERKSRGSLSDVEWGKAIVVTLLSLWHSEKVSVPFWMTVSGTVLGIKDGLSVRTDDEMVIEVTSIPSWDIGEIPIDIGDKVVLRVFFRNGDLILGFIRNITTGESVTLRDEMGYLL